jgi:hypothetical protein
MCADRSPQLSRRAVLLGGGSLALLAACGDKAKKTSSGTSTRPTASDGSRFSLVAFFGGADALGAGLRQRVTFGLGDAQGALIDNGPDQLDITVSAGKNVIDRVTSPRHNKGLTRGYYPVTFTPPQAGVYTVRATVEGEAVDASFEVGAKVAIPQAGAPLPVVDTPTTSNPRGVSPICTRSPACPLHQVNLRDALAARKPVALLVATPAYCQTAICGPVLDVLLSQQPEFGSRIQMIHVEVYADGAKAADDIAKATLAPLLQAYHLPFEPSLFLTRADGVLATRLDTIFDEVELRTALQSVTA